MWENSRSTNKGSDSETDLISSQDLRHYTVDNVLSLMSLGKSQLRSGQQVNFHA